MTHYIIIRNTITTKDFPIRLTHASDLKQKTHARVYSSISIYRKTRFLTCITRSTVTVYETDLKSQIKKQDRHNTSHVL